MDKKKYKSVTEEANSLVNGERQKSYGDPVESYIKIAKIASLSCLKEITPTDVIQIMIAIKIIRHSYSPKRDNLVDLCGYTELLHMIEEAGVS